MFDKEKAEENKIQRKKMLQNEGKRYRCRFSKVLILICQSLLPLLLGGMIFHFIWHDDFLLEKAVVCYIFFLPITVLVCIINLFAGRILAVFGEKGFFAMKISQMCADMQNREEMIYIPYEQIERIFYIDYFVEVTYLNQDKESGRMRRDTCAFSCPGGKTVAKDFAKKISKRAGGIIPAEGKGSKLFFLVLTMGYIVLFIVCFFGI